jgi:hypothetical protein
MYDSRTDKARKPQHAKALRAFLVRKDQERDDKFWCPQRQVALAERDDIEEQVILASAPMEERAITRYDIERLHGEALDYNEMAAWERELLIGSEFSPDIEVSWSSAEQDLYLMHDEPGAGEGIWEDDWPETVEPNMYTHDDSWLPIASVEGCREIFGGTDFIIQHTNVRRRTA